jgi:hypothetical protein
MTTTVTSLPAPVGASTADLGLLVQIKAAYATNSDVLVKHITDQTVTTVAHAQAMRELAALSFDPNSLERGLEAEINRNAWGMNQA